MSSDIVSPDGRPDPAEEVAELRRRLQEAEARLAATNSHLDSPTDTNSSARLHALFLLSDSALPLGSFAFSAGLESFLAHHPKNTHNPALFSRFLGLSLSSLVSLSLPYVIAGFNDPEQLEALDNDFDASTICTVARRASVKQGRALVTVWERSFRAQFKLYGAQDEKAELAQRTLKEFGLALKSAPESLDEFGSFVPNGHLPALFGVVCAALSLELSEALYMYLLNHVKTIISAGIRASVLGPYQAQGVLASEPLRQRISQIISNEMMISRTTDEAGQSVPTMDIWGGRHEIIYSRIFNS